MRDDVSVVVVTWNAAEHVERCLGSVRGYETIVVDNGSSDGTVALVRDRFPDAVVIEQANKGMGGGNNAGLRAASSRYVLLLNSDAWVVGDAVDRLAAFADAHPRTAVVGPRLLNPDGSLQRSVRGDPTVWRLATEYLFLRKLGPRTRALNAFYGAGFEHDQPREVESLFGAALLVRGEATEEVGLFDESFFMFSEETDWLYRFRRAGWQVWFTPNAEVVHLGGASHGGRLYVENLRGILRFLAKNRGPREAERARRLLLWSLRLRSVVFRGDRGRSYRDGARFLASGDVPEAPHVIGEYLRLAFATGVVLLPGFLIARALGQRSVSASLAWAFLALFAAWAAVFAFHSTIRLAATVLAGIGIAAGIVAGRALVRPHAPTVDAGPDPVAWGRRAVLFGGVVLGLLLWHVEGAVGGDGLFHEARVRKLVELGHLHLRSVDELVHGGLHPGYAFPLWHGFLALVTKLSGLDPSVVLHREASVLVPLACLVAWEAGLAVFDSVAAGFAVVAASLGLYCFAAGHGGSYVSLALPATASRQILVPAALALFFTYARSGRRADLGALSVTMNCELSATFSTGR